MDHADILNSKLREKEEIYKLVLEKIEWNKKGVKVEKYFDGAILELVEVIEKKEATVILNQEISDYNSYDYWEDWEKNKNFQKSEKEEKENIEEQDKEKLDQRRKEINKIIEDDKLMVTKINFSDEEKQKKIHNFFNYFLKIIILGFLFFFYFKKKKNIIFF